MNRWQWNIGAVVSLWMMVYPALAAESAKVGVIGAIEDRVVAHGADGALRELALGSDVFLNDRITTDAAGTAQVMFLDKSALTVSSNAEVVIDRFVYSPAESTGDLTIRNAKGALRFIGGALSKEKPVLIKTPVSTIGIRGGIVDAHVEKSGATDAIFLHGHEMTVENLDGKRMQVTQVGSGLSVMSVGSPPVVMPPEKVAERLSVFGAPPAATGDAREGAGSQTQEGGQPPADAAEAGPADSAPEADQADTSANAPGLEAAAPDSPDGAPQGPIIEAPDPGITTNVANSTQDQRRTSGITQFAANPPPADVFGIYILKEDTFKEPLSGGHVEYASAGDRFSGRLIQYFPFNAGPVFLSTLPRPQVPGFGTVSAGGVTFDGDPYTGTTYTSRNKAMYYYSLSQSNGPLELSFAFGHQVPRSGWAAMAADSVAASQAAGSHNLSFYRFLPDLSDYLGGRGGFGFFDYDIIDSRLLPAGTSLPDNNHFGLAVDWVHNRFLTGFMLWNNGPTDASLPLRRDMMLAFGSVNTSGSRLMDGRVFEFTRAREGSIEDHAMDTGHIEVDNSVYAVAGRGADGFLLKGIISPDFDSGINNPLGENIEGRRIVQPVMAASGNAAAVTASASRTTANLKGFAGGYVIRDVLGASGTPSVIRYYNTSTNDVALSRNAATGDISGTIRVTDSAAVGPRIDAYFGNAAGVGGLYDAFLADDLYAVQQGKVVYTQSAATQTYTGDAGGRGVMVGSDLIAHVGPKCTACQYAEWGVWAGEIERGTGASGEDLIDTISMIPYVVGPVTVNLGANVGPLNLGNVTYNGAMYGATRSAAGVLQRHDGVFAAGINLNTRTLTRYDASFAGMRFGFNGQSHALPGSGEATFGGIPVHNLGAGAATDISGSIRGALFGPQAQDIGGNFAVDSTSGTSAAGVYLGTRN